MQSTEILAGNYPQTHANPFPKRANSMAYLPVGEAMKQVLKVLLVVVVEIKDKQTSIQLPSICHHLGCFLLRYCWHVHRKGGTPYGNPGSRVEWNADKQEHQISCLSLEFWS